jgi:D-amino-acid dehydrogenase
VLYNGVAEPTLEAVKDKLFGGLRHPTMKQAIGCLRRACPEMAVALDVVHCGSDRSLLTHGDEIAGVQCGAEVIKT